MQQTLPAFVDDIGEDLEWPLPKPPLKEAGNPMRRGAIVPAP